MSIETVFSEVFREGGWEDVHAEPAPYRDFKVKWGRTRGWISLEVSDYLSDAPDDVLEGIARTVLARIRNEDTDYPPEVGRHLSSQGFRDAHRETFLRRIPSLTFGRGLHADLDDAVAWLRDRGLPVPEDLRGPAGLLQRRIPCMCRGPSGNLIMRWEEGMKLSDFVRYANMKME